MTKNKKKQPVTNTYVYIGDLYHVYVYDNSDMIRSDPSNLDRETLHTGSVNINNTLEL